MSTQSKHRPSDGVWTLGPTLRRLLGWSFAGQLGLLAGSVLVFAAVIYGFAGLGFVVLLLIAAVGALAGLILAWWPTRRPVDRRLLRLPLAVLGALLAVWAMHLAPLGEVLAQRAALAAWGSDSPRARLQALAPRNEYAAFFVFALERSAQTKAQVKTLLQPAQNLGIDWRFTADPADPDALSRLRSQLIDLDVALSAVPDKLPGLYLAEAQAIAARAVELKLSATFGQTMATTLISRQRDYTAVYVAFAQLMRRAAEQLRAVVDAVAAAKVTRGADGQLVYGDEATRAKIEPLIAALDQTRTQIAKLVDKAREVEQFYRW